MNVLRRPRVLDVFCCHGGASVGLHRAGFEVVGVDVVASAAYPFPFHQADALEVLSTPWFLAGFDFIWASPPCQAHSAPTKGTNRRREPSHPDLIAPTRELLDKAEIPYVIENVAGAPLRKDLTLCGEMFGLGVIMHRFFELGGWVAPQPAHIAHRGRVRGWRHGEFFDGPYVAAYGDGGGKATPAEAQRAKGMFWTSDAWALREAIPAAYGQHIGAAFLAWSHERAMRVLNGST